MNIKIIKHRSKEYEQMIQLRMEVLRKPLGLQFSDEDLEKEKADILVGVFDEQELIGCCVLTKKDTATLQLRQMAVANSRQQHGIGTAILNAAELIAKEKGYKTLMMHARDVAVGFYKKCSYITVGDVFTEVGIPHYKMTKDLG